MGNQITPVGSLPLVSVAAPAPKPVVASRSAPALPASAPAPGPGGHAAAVAQVNQHLQKVQTELKIQVDEGSGRTVFQVVQQGTGRVVLQVPSEEVLGMSRRVRELEGQVSGALVDKEG